MVQVQGINVSVSGLGIPKIILDLPVWMFIGVYYKTRYFCPQKVYTLPQPHDSAGFFFFFPSNFLCTDFHSCSSLIRMH